MTPAADRYTWPEPTPAEAVDAFAGVIGDIRRDLPPKLDDVLVFLAAVRAERKWT